MNNNLFTSTLLKSFDILDCFASDRQEIGIKEIANQIDMPQSSVYRIVQTLDFFRIKRPRNTVLAPNSFPLATNAATWMTAAALSSKTWRLLDGKPARR